MDKLLKFIMYFFRILPIQHNKVFLFSYYGSQYGGSPKAISEYITNHYPPEKFDVIWAFTDVEEKRHINGCRKVKVMSWRYFYELCTSKVIVTNYRMPEWFRKRKHQYYIQTWHSSLRLKQIEKDAEASLPDHYIRMAKKDSSQCDLLLSGCQFSTGIFRRAFWYNGEIFEWGTPTNDIFFQQNQSLRAKVLHRLQLAQDTRIVLFAPTFRNDHSIEVYQLECSKVLESMRNKFGGEWTFLVKLHPHLIPVAKNLSLGNHVMDVTTYDDIQELLYIADVLISDYSALIFDYALTRRPCFLYVPDLEEYLANERGLYFEMEKLPFKSVKNLGGLLEGIENFEENVYRQNVEQFLKQVGTFEQGKACMKLVERIDQVCYSEERRQVYETV